MKKIAIIGFLIILWSITVIDIASSAEVGLAWDWDGDMTTITGFRVYAANYDDNFDYGNPIYDGVAKTCTVIVPDNTELKYVARAYLETANSIYESANSNQVVHAVVVWINPNLRVQ